MEPLIKYGEKLLQNTPRVGKQHVVAIAVDKNNRVICHAFNSYTKTHPLQALYANFVGLPEKPFLHAEVACLIKAKKAVYKIVVVRMGKNNNLLNAKPCVICRHAIEIAEVKVVEYSIEDKSASRNIRHDFVLAG